MQAVEWRNAMAVQLPLPTIRPSFDGVGGDVRADAVRPYRGLVLHRPQIHLPGNEWRATPVCGGCDTMCMRRTGYILHCIADNRVTACGGL
jgi:hypothetical protein